LWVPLAFRAAIRVEGSFRDGKLKWIEAAMSLAEIDAWQFLD
jgi:hypothetical protein